MEFSTYLNYVKALRFDERPDYTYLKNLFLNLLHNTYNEPFVFDWMIGPNMAEDAPNVSGVI